MNTANRQKATLLQKQPIFGRSSRIYEFFIERSVAAVAFVSFAFIILIFVFIFREALPLVLGRAADDIGKVGLSRLLSLSWQPVSNNPAYGILPLIVGSLKVTLIAVGIAGPIAIFAALYTSVFAPRWAKELMKPCIEILAGIPSVVIGFFALTVLATIIQKMFGLDYRLNAFTGGVALSLAVIPIIFTVAEDSLSVLPKSMREASYALGATKWETAAFVLLPAATPGVFAAILLGIGRAFGETMIVLMATGNAALLSPDIFASVRTMSATIGAEMAEVVFGDAHYNILFFIGICLFVFSFSLNMFAEFVVRRFLLSRFGGKTR
ncbi:MAG: phosphate ABC transporter permease subunit PstC [Chitinispirillaceae bacterium]|jgi:phosphate transport system permease protein